jgi:hypothetical protein
MVTGRGIARASSFANASSVAGETSRLCSRARAAMAGNDRPSSLRRLVISSANVDDTALSPRLTL